MNINQQAPQRALLLIDRLVLIVRGKVGVFGHYVNWALCGSIYLQQQMFSVGLSGIVIFSEYNFWIKIMMIFENDYDIFG